MKLLSRSTWVAVAIASGLLAAATPASAYAGCPFSKLGAPDVTRLGDRPGDWFSASPDSNALGAALGGLGAIAALATGGTLMVRHRRLAQEAAANAAALAAEADLSTTTETLLLAEADDRAIASIESDESGLVAGLRR